MNLSNSTRWALAPTQNTLSRVGIYSLAAVTLPALILAAVVLLSMFGQAQSAPVTQRDTAPDITNLTVEKRVLPPSRDTIQVGDIITYSVRVHNTHKVRELRYLGLAEQVPMPTMPATAPRMRVETPTVEPTRVGVQYTRLQQGIQMQMGWRGTMTPNAEFEIRMPVEVHPCRADQTEETRTSRVILQEYNANGAIIASRTVAQTYTVDCPPPPATLDDIQVSLEVVAASDNPREDTSSTTRSGIAANPAAANPTEELFGAYNFLLTRAHLTNQADIQVVVGYRLAATYIGETEKNLNRTGDALLQDEAYYTPIILYPSETRTVDVWTDMRPFYRAADAWALEHSWAFDLHYLLLPAVQARASQVLPGPDAEIRTQQQVVRTRGWDLGDAPDSSSHADGVRMEAYPGVQASYPTVYNPTVSANPGPAHVRPRLFHLGRSVSVEIDADLGSTPNIDPAAGSADGDTHDDGVFPKEWTLPHCAATTIDVQVSISREAVAWFQQAGHPGYLNLWIDSNRDGKWGGVLGCDGQTAFEHAVIDHPVDVVSLGAGLHTLQIPTGVIYWPSARAQDPAWVRVMLSERPSEKVGQTGGVQHGDGRGSPQPYLLGETEDYLVRALSSAEAGPNLTIEIRGDWQPGLPAAPDRVAPAFVYQKIEWTWAVHFANRGTETAEGAQLVLEFPEQLTSAAIRAGAQFGLVHPRRDAQTIYLRLSEDDYILDGNRFILDLDPIEPGARGQLHIFFRPEIDDEVIVGNTPAPPTTAWIFKAEIFAAREIMPGDNIKSFKVEIEGVTQGAFQMRSPNSPFWVPQGTTNSRRLHFTGMLPTGETAIFLDSQGNYYEDLIANKGYINIWVRQLLDAARTDMEEDRAGIAGEYLAPGVYIEEVSFRQDGSWELTLEDLADGFYQVAVGNPAACDVQTNSLAGNDNEWRAQVRGLLHGYGTVCGLFVVDSRLSIDPMSLGFVEVPADAAQMVVGEDAQGNPKVEGRVFLPDTLNWLQGEWQLRLPVSRPGTNYVAVFGLRPDLLPGTMQKVELVDRYGELTSNIAAVETAIPMLYQTETFFFDEADALFGKRTRAGVIDSVRVGADSDTPRELLLRVETDLLDIEYPGTRRVPALGWVGEQSTTGLQPLRATTDASNSQVWLLVQKHAGGKRFMDMWDGVTEWGQPNPVPLDSQGRYSFSVPRGIYQLLVLVDGYQPYRSEPFMAEGVISREIGLVPALSGEPNAVIIMDQDGATEPARNLRPGDQVRFLNMDETPRLLRVEGALDPEWLPGATQAASVFNPGMAQTAGEGIYSPQLFFGESFDVRVGASGELIVEDANDPNTGALLSISEPTDPTDPTDPSDPSEPGDPSDPSDPTDPGDPNDPEDPQVPDNGSGGALFLPQLSR